MQILQPATKWSATSVQVVVNPAAAGVTPALVDEVVGRLTAEAAEVSMAVSPGPQGTAPLVAAAMRSGAVDVIAVLGGDGTVQQVASGVVRARKAQPSPARPPALLVLPGGSGNSTSINLWAGRNCTEILDDVLAGGRWTRRSVDLLQLTEPGAVSVLGASSGFLAEVLVEATRVHGATGRDRYLVAAATVMADPPAHHTVVSVDGSVVFDGRATLAAVGGGRCRASTLQLLPRSSLDDGLLDVCVLEALAPAAVDAMAELLVRGAHVGRPGVHYHQGREVVIQRGDGQPLVAEHDGEVLAGVGDRLSIGLLPRALDVIAPTERTV